MFYKELAEIANQLNQDDLDLDGILQTFCMRRFADRRFLASFFLEIEQDGHLRIRGHFGANPEEIGIKNGGLSLFDDHPAAESIRSDAVVCSDMHPPRSKSIKSMLISWPVESNSRVLGSIVTVSDSRWDDSKESKECLDALAMMINTSLTRKIGKNGSRLNGKLSRIPQRQERLTERQEVILKLISEGRTNGDIAEILGYSESLIRQETIRIYAVLKCNGRQEAARIYLSQFAVASSVK